MECYGMRLSILRIIHGTRSCKGTWFNIALLRLEICSGRADPVEAAGIIGRVGIAEVAPAIGKAVRGYRRPSGSRSLRNGFDEHGGVRGPRDNESEIGGRETEAWPKVEYDRVWQIPKSRRPAAKSRVPAGRPRKVIDRRGSV